MITRRSFVKKLLTVGAVFTTGKLSISNIFALAPKNPDYHRIVVLGDPHLPVRNKVTDDLKKERIIAAKRQVIEDINTWQDVDKVAVVGDLVAQTGDEEEYTYVKEYFAAVHQEVLPINGNHDFTYQDSLSPSGKLVKANAEERTAKLQRFKETFGLSELFYCRRAGSFLLIFLGPDKVENAHLTELSERQLEWFKAQLAENPKTPTIVFFHAPLMGTLLNYNKEVNTPNFIAQPEALISQLINENPQILLWVSGHTHTPLTNESYAAEINKFGTCLNIHNADMDRETIWTNSLYLYQDKVVVKTFNHKTRLWEDSLERIVYTNTI